MAVVALCSAAPVRAGDAPVAAVVELFTSQGCNSCPPADAALADLGRREGVLALAYHVDYWDYLGWRDTLGTPDNTKRQRLYREALNARSVYTPQAVVDGRLHLVGSDKAALTAAVDTATSRDAVPFVPIVVSRTGDAVTIWADAARPDERAQEAALLLVVFRAPQSVRIATGENEGHTVTYWNPVSAVQPIGLWRRDAMRLELPASVLPAGEGAAVLLQMMDARGLPGAILGAAVVRRPGEP